MISNAGSDDDGQETPLKFLLSQLGITITAQPTNQVGVLGGNVTFGPVTISNSFGGLVQYLWQIQTDGALWEDLVEITGFYEGVATNTLAVKALDNYLATRASLNFRCLLYYPGAAPISTNVVSLSIPKHTNFTPSFTAYAIAEENSVLSVNPQTLPVAVGFAGPYTYQWSFVSGSAAILCINATDQMCLFQIMAGTPAGNTIAVWKCTISNGVDTVATDNLLVCMTAFVVPPSLGSSVPFNSVPPISIDGAALDSAVVTLDPWSIISQQTSRRIGITPAVTIDDPAAQETTFSLNGPDLPGTRVSVVALKPYEQAPFGRLAIAGATAWGL